MSISWRSVADLPTEVYDEDEHCSIAFMFLSDEHSPGSNPVIEVWNIYAATSRHSTTSVLLRRQKALAWCWACDLNLPKGRVKPDPKTPKYGEVWETADGARYSLCREDGDYRRLMQCIDRRGKRILAEEWLEDYAPTAKLVLEAPR